MSLVWRSARVLSYARHMGKEIKNTVEEADEPLHKAGDVIFSAPPAFFILSGADHFARLCGTAYAARAHQGSFPVRRPFAPAVARGAYPAAGNKQRAAARAADIAEPACLGAGGGDDIAQLGAAVVRGGIFFKRFFLRRAAGAGTH